MTPFLRLTSYISNSSASLLALLTLSVTTHGHEPLTPDELVAQALNRHPALVIAEAELAAVRGERTIAGAWQNPELSVQVGRKKTRDAPNHRNHGLALAIQLTQTFEWPGKATLRQALADQNIALAETALAQFRRALEARVRITAATLAAAEAHARAASAAAEEAGRIVRILRDRPQAGPAQMIEARLIEAAALTLHKDALEQQSRVATTRAELNQLRGLPASSPLTVSPLRQPPRPNAPLPALLLASGRHPQVQLRAIELEAAQRRLRYARLSASPDVSFGPFFSRERAGDEEETTIGAALTVPLPLWNQGRGEIDLARSRNEAAEAALALARLEAESEITRLYQEWTTATAWLDQLTAEKAEEFEEAAALAARQCRTGGIPAPLYLDMQRDALAMLAARLDALVTATRCAAELHLLTHPSPQP